MCYRFQMTAPALVLAEHFDTAFEAAPPRLNIAPAQPVTIVRMSAHVSRKRESAIVLWGLIPPFVQSLPDYKLLFNARAEGLWERPSFRHAIARKRCLIPATAFYEWEHSGNAKIPWAFAIQGQPCFGMGGIWEVWSGPNGEEIESCSIITIEPNKTVGRIHTRMPLIVHPDDYAAWLSPDLFFEDELTQYMRPVPSEFMTATKADALLRQGRNELPGLSFEPEELL